MKLNIALASILGLFIYSCNSSTHQSDSFKTSFELAQKSGDHNSSTVILTQWLANDSSIQKWALDSLCFYHYFYNLNPTAVRSTRTPMYYCEKGLEQNANNIFLKDIKAKLLLEQGKDTPAYALFEGMYKETQNYSYLWDMAFINLARGKYKEVEITSNLVIADSKSIDKKVRMEHIQAQIIQEIPARAAFLYMKALLKNGQRDVMGAAELLQDALKIAPDFYAAKRSIVELQQMAMQNRK
jgi:tetratricopeptide (TPR) repeat protein